MQKFERHTLLSSRECSTKYYFQKRHVNLDIGCPNVRYAVVKMFPPRNIVTNVHDVGESTGISYNTNVYINKLYIQNICLFTKYHLLFRHSVSM